MTVPDVSEAPPVIALAGRRNVGHAEDRMRDFFKTPIRALVCAAASGADLLALDIAGKGRIRRRILLPFGKTLFRETSLEDPDKRWLEPYDRIIAEVEQAHDLVVLGFDEKDPAAYSKTNTAILEEARRLAKQENTKVCAVVVWDGESRGPEDFTADFLDQAHARNMTVTEIKTLL